MNKHFWNAVLSVSDEEAEQMMEMLELYERHQEQVQREKQEAQILAIVAEIKAQTEAERHIKVGGTD